MSEKNVKNQLPKALYFQIKSDATHHRDKKSLFDPTIVCERVTVQTQQRTIPFSGMLSCFANDYVEQ